MNKSMTMKPLRKQLLHDRLADQLRASLRDNGRPGQRLESEAVMARNAGVSIVTLRNAMLILEREGLIERSPGRGTFVSAPPEPGTLNQEPSTKNQELSSHLAIYCGGELFSPHPSYFYLGAVSALRRLFTEQNLVSQVYFNHREIEDREVTGPMVEAGDTCPEFTQAVAERRIKAAAFLSGGADCSWSQSLLAQGVPRVGTFGFDVGVTTDWAAMGQLGAQQLVARGCRRLALIAWAGFERLPLATRTDLVGGFCKEIQRLGLTLNEAWIRHDLASDHEGAGWEDLREIWNSGAEKPDGLVVADDMMLDDVARAAAELSIAIPSDLRIVSHVNRGAVYAAPFPVDRLELDPVEFGQTLGKLLLQRLRGETPKESMVLLKHRLVEAMDPAASTGIGDHEFSSASSPLDIGFGRVPDGLYRPGMAGSKSVQDDLGPAVPRR
jgi:DNA-binding transcriptional regulator YhcF (GntR family)